MTDLAQLPHLDKALSAMLGAIDSDVARTLDKALGGGEITVDEGTRLFDADGASLLAIMATADTLRRHVNGDVVTYVVNRNINFTNVCIKHCGFCAFSRDYRQEEGYFLPLNEIIRRAREAWELGATEVCIQAGLPPKMQGSLYIDLTRELKKELPKLHVHAFSPEEVLYGAVRSQCTIEQYLQRLQEAGIGSIPGTSAEILDPSVRDKIGPGRITAKQWREVITTAHKVGIPTTSTIMFGHVETNRQRAAHIAFIRDIQKETGGITEFVPLSFVHGDSPMWSKQMVHDLRPGATGADVVKMHAIARIMLHGWIHNIQTSWVKEGPKLAQVLLASGCNDVGGTLINESISTSAGASFGELVPPRELRRWIRDLGRVPAERTTTYRIRRRFDVEPEEREALDLVQENAAERFGSYATLIKLEEFRYSGQRAPSLEGPTWTEVQLKRKAASASAG